MDTDETTHWQSRVSAGGALAQFGGALRTDAPHLAGTAGVRACEFGRRRYVFSAKGAAHTSLGQRPRSDASQ